MRLEFGLTSLVLVYSLNIVRASRTEGNQFDFFTLTQAWPPGTCAEGKHDRHKCNITNKVNTWTVHGLWPNRKNGTSPTNCSSSEPFNFDKIKSLQSQLDTYWPNIYGDTLYLNLWKHEWFTHGRCATSVKETRDEYNYFDVGLALNRKYDILGMLSNASINPKENIIYSANQFVTAIKKAIGVMPRLQCTCETQGNGAKTPMIFQVQICLDLLLQPISCRHHNLDADKMVSNTTKANICKICSHFTYPPIKHF